MRPQTPSPARVLLATLALAAIGALSVGLTRRAHNPPWSPARAAASLLATAHPAEGRAAAAVPDRAWPGTVRWVAVGGGADPASNPVSLEQDLALWAHTLGPGGVTLFAGGAGRSPVQVSNPTGPGNEPSKAGSEAAGEAPNDGDSLERRLGEIFAPRDGRQARYQPTRLAPHGDAAAPSVLQALSRASDPAASSSPAEPLFVYVAAHGEPGGQPRDNHVVLWGGTSLSAAALADELDAVEGARPLRLVMTSCFSGGFAELVFVGGDESAGPSPQDRCGLFASTWDTEASGCDPNPDRRAQEAYGLHFLHALDGRDRSGKPLPRAVLDLDGDGAVSLLEAHTRARIASRALGVPTTTSERWLRFATATSPPAAAVAGPLDDLPEERAVVAALGAELGLPTAEVARLRLESAGSTLDRADEHLAGLEAISDEAAANLRIALLERWPVLDDPYHPDYRATLQRHRAAILSFVDESVEARAYLDASDAELDVRLGVDQLELRGTRVERLVRAHETLELAAELARRGGPALERYGRLLRCERSAPR